MFKTIKERAYLFAALIVGCSVVIIVIITSLFTANVRQTEEMLSLNSQVYSIQRQVTDFPPDFKAYCVLQNEESAKYVSEAISSIRTDADRLSRTVLARRYVREIDDLSNMTATLYEQTMSMLKGETEYSVNESYGTISYTCSLILRYFDYIYDGMQEYYEIEHHRLRNLAAACYAVSAVAVAVFLGAAFFVIGWIKKSLLTPFDRITDKAARFKSDGSQTVRSNGDELLMLEDTVNEMLERVERQMDSAQLQMQMELDLKQQKLEKAKMERLLSETEAKALRARINPHFLYNTLNIIAQMAYIENAERTELLIEAVSDYFRYNLKDLRELSTIGEEFKNIEDYTYIQKMRFGKRFDFQIRCDQTVVDVPIPAMVLQPIVENSIVHGFGKNCADGVIKVEVERADGGRVTFRVEDNGDGFPQDKIDDILKKYNKSKQANTHADSIGLNNVFSRLLACFHDELSISISSVPGESTVVSFTIPMLNPRQIEELSVYEAETI